MRINILSIGCGLAFEPYLELSLSEFLADATVSRVVRQGGSGLIVRSDGDLVLRHEHRQSSLGKNETQHYSATLQVRREFYDVSRMQDEVVLANFGKELLLSHPQSEMWLGRESVAALVEMYGRNTHQSAEAPVSSVPDWLTVSTGGERLLLSDQRTGRWVLLGEDHITELARRLDSLELGMEVTVGPAPPTIQVKGLSVHLQSAFKLAAALLDFGNSEDFAAFEEITPAYWLKASRSSEGIELADSNTRIGLTAREARKWQGIIREELCRLRASQVERGGVRTVVAHDEDGSWVLQWGDEVYVPKSVLSRLSSQNGVQDAANGYPRATQVGEFLVLLNPVSGASVALTEDELGSLIDKQQTVR
jgi:hypothetical protein